jgi:hypothetical protein
MRWLGRKENSRFPGSWSEIRSAVQTEVTLERKVLAVYV